MRRIIQGISLTTFLLGSVSQGCAMNHNGSGPGDTVTITGIVRVVGNEPFTHLVVTDADAKTGVVSNWQIIGPFAGELKNRYQMKRMTLEGIICMPQTPEFRKCLQPSKIIKDGSSQ